MVNKKKGIKASCGGNGVNIAVNHACEYDGEMDQSTSKVTVNN